MKKKPLTESEWEQVFTLRCRSKRGEDIGEEGHDLCTRAYKEDEERYGKMDAKVFNATVPFGPCARMEEDE